MFHRPLSPIKQYLIGFGLILASLFLAVISFFWLALAPRQQAQTALTRWASDFGQLSNLREFQLFNGQESVYSLVGDDATGQTFLLLQREGEEEPTVFELDQLADPDALSQREGLAPDRVRGGYVDNRPVWEIKSQTNYYLFDLKTGELIRVLG